MKTHIDIEAARAWNLLELSLRAGSPPQVVQLADRPQHRGQRSSTRLPTQASMCTKAVMDVAIQGPIDVDLVGVRKVFRLAVGADKAAKDLVTRLDVNFPAVVIDSRLCSGETIRTESAVETNTFHGIVQQFLVRFRSWGLCEIVDGRQMLWMIEVVVDQLGKLLQLSLPSLLRSIS